MLQNFNFVSISIPGKNPLPFIPVEIKKGKFLMKKGRKITSTSIELEIYLFSILNSSEKNGS